MCMNNRLSQRMIQHLSKMICVHLESLMHYTVDIMAFIVRARCLFSAI